MFGFLAVLTLVAGGLRAWAGRASFRAALVSAALVLVATAEARACPPSAQPEPVPVMTAARARIAQGQPLRILAIGSSSTQGVGASRQNSFPAQLEGRLAVVLGPEAVEVVNAGVSGERAPSTLARLEAFLGAPQKPDLVIWQVGTNDTLLGGTPQRLAALVERGLDAAAAAGVPVIVIDQQYFPLLFDVRGYERFVAAVDDTARARQVSLLPRYAMMKQWSVEDPKGFRGLFAWDRFHMNGTGYACLADLLSSAILEALRDPESPKPVPQPPHRPERSERSEPPGEAAVHEGRGLERP